MKHYSTVTPGAARFDKYLPLLNNKRVAIVTNATGVVGGKSIVDTLLSLKVNIKKVFGPEHGFRGDAEAGVKVKSQKDAKTRLPVISLYGANKKPTKEQLKDVDIVLYDIQDVGVRFYTYISTMSYVMEACAESNKEMIVLDRPNPNGFYIDGPVLTSKYKSFLGLHPVPIVYGMTTGEYAQMANGEGWLKNRAKCRLTVITMHDYCRDCTYNLPLNPSPNLPNLQSILLYPSLGLFEGTIMSLGRGTQFPFQVIGHPEYPEKTFSFTPVPTKISATPKYVNLTCYGTDLRKDEYAKAHPCRMNLSWLQNAFDAIKIDSFFDRNFNFHAGDSILQQQVKNKLNEKSIRNSWQKDLEKFRQMRRKYLLYPDLK